MTHRPHVLLDHVRLSIVVSPAKEKGSAAMAAEKTKKLAGGLRMFDMMMLVACSILNTDLISSNTSAGTPIITWWIIIGVLYLIPMSLLTTELSLAFPKNGGLYHWIDAALGPRWATRANWLYWANGAFMPPASFLMVADLICTCFFPEVTYLGRTAIALVLVWVSIAISCLPLVESKRLFDVVGIINITVYLGVFIAGIVYVATGNAPANDISPVSLLPRMDTAAKYVPIALFCSSGIEIVAQSVEDSENPERDLKKATSFISVVFIVLNSIAALGILLICPIKEMSIMSGIADIFTIAWNSRLLYLVTIFCVILGIFTQICSWTIGGSRSAAEMAKAGEFPHVFAGCTKAGMPRNAMIIDGIAASIILVFYALVANTAAGLYYSLMSCTTIAATIPYVIMLIAYCKLRKTTLGESYHGYRTPHGVAVAWVVQVMQVFVTMLLIWIPGVGFTSDAPTTTIGCLVMIAIGELVMRRTESAKRPRIQVE